MAKWLVLAAICVLVFFAAKAIARSRASRASQDREAGREAESMVSCARCGVHLPRGDALEKRGRYYCGEAHASQDTG